MNFVQSNIYISFWASMCSTFSLLVVEWKLCAHTTNDVQTSKHTQCYTILACCWYQWCEYCWFVIFQLFFLKIFVQISKSNVYISIFELRSSMCSTFSLLVIEWKLCAHTTTDVQTSKLAQRDTILACCWYHWCEYCRFVIFQLFSLKFDEPASDVHSFATSMCSILSLFWISSGNCAHTLQATYKHQNFDNVILY